MRVFRLGKSDKTYSCNSYLILGDWNHVEDINTVIDPGTDGFILDEIERIATGFGKVAVAQVILTHNHFDHIGGVSALKRRYGTRVTAFVDGPGVDELVRDGQFIKAGDDCLEVIHTPGHSSDSICLYAPQVQAVFSGDTQLRMTGTGGNYRHGYLEGLEKLAARQIQSIYSGHDEPVTKNAQATIMATLARVMNGVTTNAGNLVPSR